MSRFTITNLPLAGLRLVERQVVGDGRGFLSRMFCAEELIQAGWDQPIAQINHTYTSALGTVRGMHFQYPPHAEKKLVHCLRGEIWDVAVDLRAGSPTFLQWHAEFLSADNRRALLIPEGFAHGFQAMTNDVEMIYMHSAFYSASGEGGVDANDPQLAISWPLPVIERSARDQSHAPITNRFSGLAMS